MFRRSSDGVAVPASIRLNDGALLNGTINCGMSGRLDALLLSDVPFIEFVSKDGQQRFLANHQIASIEPLASVAEPKLPPIAEELDVDAYAVLGLKLGDTMEMAKLAFQQKLIIYSPDRWNAQDIPFEFGRYAAEKTRQINMAFTIVKGDIQARIDSAKAAKRATPMFGAKVAS
jgi:hypothetical protein